MNETPHAGLCRHIEQAARPLDVDTVEVTFRRLGLVLGCREVDHDVVTLQLARDDRAVLQWRDYELDARFGECIAARLLGGSVDRSYDRDGMPALDCQRSEPAADEPRAAG